MIDQYYYGYSAEHIKENEVMTTYGNMFLEDAEQGVFVPHFNRDLIDRFPEPIFYPIGEDIPELLEFQKRKKILK